MIDYINTQQLTTQWILETHAHADHITGAHYLREQLGGAIAIGTHITQVQQTFKDIFNLEASFNTAGKQFDKLLTDGETLQLGQSNITAISVAGHTPACMAYLADDVIFVGDTLFAADVGTARCDFPGGDAVALYQSIQRIFELPDTTRIFLCHDYPPTGRAYEYESSVLHQKNHNIHIHKGISESDFVAMRQKKDATLAVPRLILPAIQLNIRAGEFPPPEDNGICYLKTPLNTIGK